MHDKAQEDQFFTNTKTVYGPVESWRFGMSLGVDPIFSRSTCSFNCLYCQLGQIQDITTLRKEYVATKNVLADIAEVLQQEKNIDVITYSGSGEPTLASNIGEMIKGVRELAPEIPQYILTNATELYCPDVRQSLLGLDKIIVKVDAANEEAFQLINRPAPGVTLERSITGILALKEEFEGEIEVQTMFMPINDRHIDDLARLLKRINPDIVQLNTPKRPYPMEWHRENRGNHKKIFDYDTRELKTINRERAEEVQQYLEKETGLKILSVYRD